MTVDDRDDVFTGLKQGDGGKALKKVMNEIESCSDLSDEELSQYKPVIDMSCFPQKEGYTAVPMCILIPDEYLEDFYELTKTARLQADWYIDGIPASFEKMPLINVLRGKGTECK